MKHEKKVYVGPDQKIYVNKSLPLYFRVSVSPDANAPSYLLPSETTKAYANPMYLDTEGRNTLRSPSAVDTSTHTVVMPKMDVQFAMYADGIAPETAIKFTDSKGYTIGGVQYFGKGLKVVFSASDATSGLESIYISTNGAPYTVLSVPDMVADQEQHYVLRYYSVDHVGNAEAPKTSKFAVDLTPPVTKFTILGESKGKVLSSKASISFTSSDTLSGVDKIYYSVNDGPATIYKAPIPIGLLKDEKSKITYYAIDHVGNREEEKTISTSSGNMGLSDGESSSYSYYIDKEPPSVKFEIEGDRYEKGNNLYLSGRSQFKIIAADEKSGVDKIFYSVDNTLLKNTYTEPFSMDQPGVHVISFAASDYVGNYALAHSQKVMVDVKPPVSEVSFQGPLFKNRDTLFVTSATQMIIRTYENGSGLKNVTYRIDGDSGNNYEKPIRVAAAGYHVLKFQSTDEVNNTSAQKEKSFFVDNLPPEIHWHFSVQPIGEKVVRDEKYVIYPSNAILYMAATDNASGGEKVMSRMNDSKVLSGKNPLSGFLPGNYKVDIEAWDVLGNKSTQTIRFSIEN